MTKIKDIVSINSQAVLSNAIQLAWYNDPTKKAENDRLVSGYVFGNGVNRRVGNHQESASLPVFEQIRNAFGNPQASNIFTVVARYGHGKSHFALVLANYFGLAPDSPVVAGIINHIETCSNKATADQFRFFKNQTQRPQLVVTLVGHNFQDLRQGFLQALRRALDADERTRNVPIKSISTKAAEWLKSLTDKQLAKADEFLADSHQTDVDSLIAALDRFESGKEVIVKELSRALLGIEANFGADVNLKEIIKETVDTLCAGADAPFHRMLILFDELGVYAGKWCHNSTAAGGLAPQEIFEACSDRPGKICFVGFVQRELDEFVKNYSPELQAEFKRWAGRMLPDAIYHLISNLEEVISKLLVKKPEWRRVIEDNSPRLLEESSVAREAIKRYSETWDANQFYNTVTRDCFPLHPLTTGLLCSFDFTQGSRTIIGAVDSMLRSAEENEISQNGRLKWIRAIQLVEEFKSDLSKKASGDFANYEHAVENALTTDADAILFDVLKALLLFKEGKMTKQNRYEHAQLLAHLAGYTIDETKDALLRLQNDYDAVRYSMQRREYEFTGATSTRTIVIDMARQATVGKRLEGLVKSLEKLEVFKNYLPPDSQAREFKADYAVEGDEWFLAPRYLDAAKVSAEEVKKLCRLTIDEKTARGTVIYLVSGNAAELDEARGRSEHIFNQLKQENYAHPFVIAIPREAAANLEKHLLYKEFMVYGMSNPQKIQFADSHRAAVDFTNKELSDELIAHLRTVEYVLPSELSLKFGARRKSLDEIADALFTEAYKFRAPSNSVSMKSNSTRGNTATAEIAKQLIVNDLNFAGLNQEKQNIVKQVLTEGANKWGVLDAQYKLQSPKDLRVKQAWSFLSNNVSKEGWTTFDNLISKLTLPPFGYDEYTATFLIAAWIGKHKHELGFKDNRKDVVRTVGNLPQTGMRANLTLGELQNNLDKAKTFIKFLRDYVSVQHSGQAIQTAAKQYLEQIQTVRDLSESKKLFEQAGQILQTLAIGDPLIPQINDALKDLAEWLTEAEGRERNLGKYHELITGTNDITNLLKVQSSLNSFGREKGLQSNDAFVETLRRAEEKLGNLAERQSQTVLPRIESYDAVRGTLEKSRKALNHAGRPDLENLFIAALERVENDYRRFQTEANEKPIINEINQIQTAGMPLAYSLRNLNRVNEILTNDGSENISRAALAKQNQLNEQIKNLRDFVEKLPSRVASITDIRAGEDLQREIYQKQSRYDDAPEAEDVRATLTELSRRIEELKEERQRKLAEEEENRRRRLEEEEAQRRSEMEKATVQNIIAQFERLNDNQQRFECLQSLARAARAANMSRDQIQAITDILWR
ncbi:MAG TPA: hypothetical protein VF571_20340 [Pyrinomonadaceae bacterium]|jgi:hypothetical protein